eukprot:scaffold10166_cov146-Isochrysis_galbana.AAC.6
MRTQLAPQTACVGAGSSPDRLLREELFLLSADAVGVGARVQWPRSGHDGPCLVQTHAPAPVRVSLKQVGRSETVVSGLHLLDACDSGDGVGMQVAAHARGRDGHAALGLEDLPPTIHDYLMPHQRLVARMNAHHALRG